MHSSPRKDGDAGVCQRLPVTDSEALLESAVLGGRPACGGVPSDKRSDAVTAAMPRSWLRGCVPCYGRQALWPLSASCPPSRDSVRRWRAIVPLDACDHDGALSGRRVSSCSKVIRDAAVQQREQMTEGAGHSTHVAILR